ncbi:MAG: pseudouridine synthase, partial [Clostridia bacterium]|nr:pseudouridine synthase [Clostridia bacterium]
EDELVNYYEKDEDSNEASVYDMDSEMDAKEVRLKYKTVKKGFQTSLVEVELITGKSHQIRAQLAHISHPIVGDMKYGDEEVNEKFRTQMKVKSQLLCAYRIVINHKEYKIDCDYEQYVR